MCDHICAYVRIRHLKRDMKKACERTRDNMMANKSASIRHVRLYYDKAYNMIGDHSIRMMRSARASLSLCHDAVLRTAIAFGTCSPHDPELLRPGPSTALVLMSLLRRLEMVS